MSRGRAVTGTGGEPASQIAELRMCNLESRRGGQLTGRRRGTLDRGTSARPSTPAAVEARQLFRVWREGGQRWVLRRSDAFEATAVAVRDSLTLADGVDQSLITAGLQQLQRFRDELYRRLG